MLDLLPTACHVYSCWRSFKTFVDNSNWAGLFLGLLIPTVPLAVHAEIRHRQQEAARRRLEEAQQRHHRQHLHMLKLLHLRRNGTEEEWDKHLSSRD